MCIRRDGDRGADGTRALVSAFALPAVPEPIEVTVFRHENLDAGAGFLPVPAFAAPAIGETFEIGVLRHIHPGTETIGLEVAAVALPTRAGIRTRRMRICRHDDCDTCLGQRPITQLAFPRPVGRRFHQERVRRDRDADARVLHLPIAETTTPARSYRY